MTAAAMPDPEPLERVPAMPSVSSVATGWARAFSSHPSQVAVVVEVAAALAIASVLPLDDWPGSSLIALVASLAAAVAIAGVRIAWGARLPRWSLHVDVALGNCFVSVIAAAGANEHVNLANLYLVLEVFALLYLPIRSALVHLSAAGAAYAVVLAVGPRTTEPAVVEWLSVFATGVVLGAVMVGLVHVLRSTAREDVLTGLPNRRSWDECLGMELERAGRSGEPLSVAVVDLDGFKAINDAYGHDFGDRVLQDAARSWKAVTRGGDLVARLGGDEFGLLAPGVDELAARILAERLIGATPHGVSASVGVATWDRTERASDLLRRADRTMYRSKRRSRRGGGRVR